ncbi:hypothetical protein BJX70DRAFT_396032 [Aspergillus crustosus]
MPKLFIEDLAWNTTNASLRAAFEIYGEVQESVVHLDPHTQRSRGSGFVIFTWESDAEKALHAMNNEEYVHAELSLFLITHAVDRACASTL